jgi:hypothetical protein
VGGGFGMYGEERCMQCFGGETWRKDTLGRPKFTLERNIKMDHKEIGGALWRSLVDVALNPVVP